MSQKRQTKIVPIDSVSPHPSNVRQGDVGAIAESLKEFDQYRPIVVQRSTGHILAGNHTWRAAKALNWAEIEATLIDVDDAMAKRILLADNRTHDLGTYDERALAALLREQAEADALAGTGWDGDTVDDLLMKALADEAKDKGEGVGLGTPVINYDLIFETEAQKDRWYAFLKYLRLRFPEGETHAERIDSFLTDLLGE